MSVSPTHCRLHFSISSYFFWIRFRISVFMHSFMFQSVLYPESLKALKAYFSFLLFCSDITASSDYTVKGADLIVSYLQFNCSSCNCSTIHRQFHQYSSGLYKDRLFEFTSYFVFGLFFCLQNA